VARFVVESRMPESDRSQIRPISAAEHRERALALLAALPTDVRAVVLFDDQYVQYLTGFVFAMTERPIAAVVLPDGERILFVPRLETEHATEASTADRVVDYPEYPGRRHPMEQLLDLLEAEGGRRGAVGVDHDGYPSVMGYVPRPMRDEPRLADSQVLPISSVLDRIMAIKSEHEVALIRESARWGARAHRLMQDATRPGLTEGDVAGPASRQATAEMVDAMGPGYRTRNRWISGALTLYRGQIGPKSANPHALADDVRFAAGDVLVTGAGADVWGYLSELERTMFLGHVPEGARAWFDHMLALQDLAFETIRAGTRASKVDEAVQGYVDRHGLRDAWRHHVGHSLGQRIHESPFLDVGDDTVLEAGMVLSVEPGLYVPGLGGFRHSDTILVTVDGTQMLTEYPRDLEALTIPVEGV
jgi:Xaa-Pro aminopeptidase